MTKRLIHVIVIFVLAFAAGFGYLAAITVPINIRNAIIGEIENATGKRVFAQSLSFNIFGGVILENAVIYDSGSIYIWAKSVSCGIPLKFMHGSTVSIPSVTINSPAIYLDRRPDGSFNILDLIRTDYRPNAAAYMINRIVVKNGRAIFIDRTLYPAFKARIDDISADVKMSTPDKVALNLSCSMPEGDKREKIEPSPLLVKFAGLYFVSRKELAGRANVNGLSLDEFKDYYKTTGIDFPEGRIDADANVRLTDDMLDLDVTGRINGLGIVNDALTLKADSLLKLMLRYDLKTKAVEYAGKFDVERMDIEGIKEIGRLENIKALVEFDDSRLWSENVAADALGIRWNARINIFNYAAPVVDIYADSEARLGAVQKMLKNEFNISLPAEISGNADINLAIQSQSERPVNINGYVMLRGATVSLGSGNFPIEGVTGEIQFNLAGAKWSKIKLKHRDVPYVTSGELINFTSPKVKADLSSKDLSLNAVFSINKNVTKVSHMDGRYLGSAFFGSGDVDFTGRKAMATAKGAVNMDLKDLKKLFKDSAALQKLKLTGKTKAEFGIKGNLKDIKSCSMRTKITSDIINAYGIKITDVIIDYAQSGGIGQVRSLRGSMYGGSVYASGKIEWARKALPYTLNIDAKDIKLELLKAGMGFKDKDVSGDLKALASLTGTLKDTTKFYGTGRVSITNGRIWQLNLFKGVGTLIFSNDFDDIVFTEGSSDVKMSNKSFQINNFTLKSDLLNLYGSGTVGMDKSVNATLKPEINESVLGSGTHEKIAMAVSSNTVIKVTGTVVKPEYKTQANFGDVVGGIASAIFQQ